MMKHDLSEQSSPAACRAYTRERESLLMYEAGQQAIAEAKALLDTVAHQINRPVCAAKTQRPDCRRK